MKQTSLVMNTFVFESLLDAGQSQVDWLAGIKDLGIDVVEVRREYFRDDEEIIEIKDKAEALDMELFYAVPDTLIQGRLMDAEKLSEYFKEYKDLGAKQFKIVAGYTDGLTEEELASLKGLMTEYGVRHLALENDQSDYSTPAKMRAIIEQLREAGISAGITFDTGNFIITGQSPLESAQELKDIVTFIHMKNVVAESGEIRLIDQGDVPIFEVLAVFDQDVPRAIEYPCGEDPFTTVQSEIEKILQA